MFVVAANFQYFSGKPWAATALVALPQTGNQATQRVLLEPRGSQRLSSQALLDLCFSRTVSVRGLGRIELLLDVLNALNLNDTAEEALATDNLFSPSFRQPHGLHGSASRDARRKAEPGSVVVSFTLSLPRRSQSGLRPIQVRAGLSRFSGASNPGVEHPALRVDPDVVGCGLPRPPDAPH